MSLPKKLVIDRTKWGRGHSKWGLWPQDGRMCCLGHLAAAAGVDENEVYGCYRPSSAKDQLPSGLAELLLDTTCDDTGCSPWANHAMDLNDGQSCPDREARLIAHFAEAGIDLSFVGIG